MKRLEKILGLLSLLSLIALIIEVPGGLLLSIVTMLFLSFIYYPFGFAFFNDILLRKIFKKDAYKGVSTWKIVGSIAVGISLSSALMGILFKINHWPGADFNLYVGLVTMLLILIISVYKYLNTKSAFYLRIIKRVLIVGSIGILVWVISI
ncbi:MAG: hypothetical protein KAG84_06275 [Bacteroidales bacterium]|nr:hypothetical protein [Bacteroidales bacterium]